MKKRLGNVIVIAVVLVFILGMSIFAQDTIKWRLQSYAGPSLNQYVVENAIKMFNEAANGEMVIDVYSADQLVPHGELFRAVKERTIDMAVSDDYSMGSPVDIAIFSAYYPAVGRVGLDINTLFEEYGLQEVWEKAYKGTGVIPLSHGSWDPCNIATKEPIKSIEDLKGKRLFTSLFVGRFLKEKYGVTPVVMPVDDVGMALETGMIDGVAWSGVTELYSIGWAESLNYVLTNPIAGAWSGGWFVNEESWNKIPSHLQTLLKLAIAKSNYYRLHWYWAGEARKRVKGKELKFTSIPADEWGSVQDKAKEYWEQHAKMSENAAKVVEIFKEYNNILQQAGAPYVTK